MKTHNILIIHFLLIAVAGCASPLKVLRIETKPGKADVYKYIKRNRTFVKVGQTPFEVKGKDLDKLSDFSAFKIEKNGFVVEHLVYDKSSKASLDYLVPLKPVEAWSDIDAEVSSKLAGAIAQKVQSINRLVMNKELDKALKLTDELVEQYPKAHTFYDIKGSIFVLKGQKQAGISNLKKSLSLNPGNIETEKLLKALLKERQ